MGSPPLAVLRLSPDGVVIAANPAAERLLGPCLGRRCDEVVLARGSDRRLLCLRDCGRELAEGCAPSREQRLATVRNQSARVICAAADDQPTVIIICDGAPRADPRVPLSPGEARVLDLVARGLSDKEIAEVLDVQTSTVKTLLARGRAKLGARTRAEAVARALRSGFIA
ncbi:MAG: PAS and helix-turn-helix domain-containing protein [Deltaproteobacteria bacterium]|nr:MAG: PAS and helix-turn-helix domain-containing protein [Deltaproteobacteria bacterium]